MEIFFNDTIGMVLLCGAIFIIAAAVLYLFPPKKRNFIYGYRTAASLRSQERWDFAQRYGAKQLAIGGALMIFISFAEPTRLRKVLFLTRPLILTQPSFHNT